MKHYYALFKETKEAIEVEFPDLPGCVTFGENWDEAIENAVDVLGAWLANAESKFIIKPSTHKDLEKLKGTLIPISVDDKILEKYLELKRINIIIPAKTLHRVDRYRKAKGLKRSKFMELAAEAYLNKHKLQTS